MTVGELVYQQAIKDGYNPEVFKGLIPSLTKIAETHHKAMNSMREPLERATKAIGLVAEVLKPQMEAISKIKLPEMPAFSVIPESFYDDKGELMTFEFTRPVQDVRIINPEEISTSSAKRMSEYVTASYLLPQNATWEALIIKFIDGHIVDVSYPNMESKKFDFKDMGFINTKTYRPDFKWELLRKMANNGGALTNEKWDRRLNRNVKYELNERLKNFFGMKENPIPHYTKKNGYYTLFTLQGEK